MANSDLSINIKLHKIIPFLCSSPAVYDVTCSSKVMKITIYINVTETTIYLERLKGYYGCKPEIQNDRATFTLSLDDIYSCGTTKILNKIQAKCHSRDAREAKCSSKKNINITDYIEAYAAVPYLNLALRQNGKFLDTTLHVQPGTSLEMLVYLDKKSSDIYGLLTTYLKVTDSTPQQEEIIIMNGCSIDPYIFGNFQTNDNGNTLFAKFRAFKFPDSNYVLFVGTVNVCLQKCKEVPCGNNQYGYGRKKREIPAELPQDPNRVFEVEMTAFLRVEHYQDHFTLKKESMSGEYEDTLSNHLTQSLNSAGLLSPTLLFLMTTMVFFNY
ncbi:uncharacterized protein LOC111615594 [Centruroides sculpturatus]|uniref:uncharacterized protein LOC111615594 n=1 Tax=Centruroides sculpturatus TaxID=218467 RepID=UPI000C6D8C3D|nr:uncharacterized protein LOC111615594 [Centruroides sculpturatus]